MSQSTEVPTISSVRCALDDRYLDRKMPLEDRVELLLKQMTVEEKAGLFFHAMITMGRDGGLSNGDHEFGLPSNHEYVVSRHMTHFNLLAGDEPKLMARWHNKLQALAERTRLKIPITISTDPRNSYKDNPLAGLLAGHFSVWPEALGLAATRDSKIVQQFAETARQEYLAVGIRVALHPQIDLATEPRWARQLDTFGEDVNLTCRLVEAYVRGFQGKELGPSSVATMTKHFPGGGPQKDGEDPHFSYGREQVYPGGQFELHLKPFEVAIAAGTSQIMPYYGMPVGTEYEEVGFGFNKSIITGLLRERYGFNGIVCTDWGLLTDAEVEGEPFPARAWGVEHLSPKERMKKALDAGIDQFGGEACPELLVELVKSGDVSEERLDASARRLLKEKFLLGLFDNRMVDEKIAISVVGCQAFREAGLTAQRASITLLKNDVQADGRPVLPFSRGAKLYVEGINEKVASHYGHVVSSPDEADIAILRVQAPFEKRATKFENYFHAGSLDMDAELVGRIRDISRKVPTVVDIFLDRPAILSSIVDEVGGLVANFGAHPTALLDVLVGDFAPTGTLPFDIPASMAAVQKSRPDVPFDTKDATFRFGHGLNYGV